MASSFQLRIVTPRAQLLDEQVSQVTAPGSRGEFGVLPNHAALLTSLEPGVLVYQSGKVTEKVAVRGGFAEVLDNVMTVLADEAIPGREIDQAAARVDLQAAEETLGEKVLAEEARLSADEARRWATARIDASR